MALGGEAEEFDRGCYQLGFLMFFPENKQHLLRVTVPDSPEDASPNPLSRGKRESRVWKFPDSLLY